MGKTKDASQFPVKKTPIIVNAILIELLNSDCVIAATRVKLQRMLDGTLALGDQIVQVLFEV